MAKTKKDLTEEETGEPVEVEVKQPLDKIVPIRLSADHWAELYRYAHELGIGPTTLARMWILEKLALVRATTSPAYAQSGVPSVPNWLTPALLRLSWDQSRDELDKLVSALPQDVKHSWDELAERSMLLRDAEKPEDAKAFAIAEVLARAQRLYAAYLEAAKEVAKAKELKVEV